MAEDNRYDMSDAEEYSGFQFESLDDKYQTDDDRTSQNTGKTKAVNRNDNEFYEEDLYSGTEEDEESDAHEDDKYESQDDAVPVWSYLLHLLLFTIPVAGVVFMLIYIISDSRNRHLKKLALIWLFVQAAVVILVAAAVSFGLI